MINDSVYEQSVRFLVILDHIPTISRERLFAIDVLSIYSKCFGFDSEDLFESTPYIGLSFIKYLSTSIDAIDYQISRLNVIPNYNNPVTLYDLSRYGKNLIDSLNDQFYKSYASFVENNKSFFSNRTDVQLMDLIFNDNGGISNE